MPSQLLEQPASEATLLHYRDTEHAEPARLTIGSRNYSWECMQAWLLCRFVGLNFDEVAASPEIASDRYGLPGLRPEAPCLQLGDTVVWGSLAIGAHLSYTLPDARLLPADPIARAHAHSIDYEMVAGLSRLRAALPMNLSARHVGWPVWSGVQDDLEWLAESWQFCLARYGGPFLFGELSMSDAIAAPMCSRLYTYDVSLGPVIDAYAERVRQLPEVQEWYAAARAEGEAPLGLEVEF
jgi:glutathione S-transferase